MMRQTLTFPFRKRAARLPEPQPQANTPRPPVVAAQLLKKLEFKVLKRLDGYLFGDYSGLFYGPSLNLAEVREYQPGDEVRRIDWNVTARTGKVHVRHYIEEREISAWLIVDLSPSMDFGTRRISKRDLALEFTALVASVISRQGNKVGAFAAAPSGIKLSPLSSSRRQAFVILNDLLKAAAEPTSGPPQAELGAALEQAERRLRRRTLLFIVSDFLSAARPGGLDPNWGKALRRLAYRHDVIAVRVSDPAEHRLPEVGDLRVRDPETGQEVWVDTGDKRVRQAHARLVAKREAALERLFRSARIDTLSLSTHQDIIPPVLAFSARRKGRL